jgi:hypothetical protein
MNYATDRLKSLGYDIRREFCGCPKPLFVLRFRGEFVESSPFLSSILLCAACHNAKRNGGLVNV